MKTVHKVCSMLRKHDAVIQDWPEGKEWRCQECPTREIMRGHEVKRGCRYRAEEHVNIVLFGNPWGWKYFFSRRAWPRKRTEPQDGGTK